MSEIKTVNRKYYGRRFENLIVAKLVFVFLRWKLVCVEKWRARCSSNFSERVIIFLTFGDFNSAVLDVESIGGLARTIGGPAKL